MVLKEDLKKLLRDKSADESARDSPLRAALLSLLLLQRSSFVR